MKPYTPETDRGRAKGGHDIHHRTADLPKAGANKVAKTARHAARQDGKATIARELTADVVADRNPMH
ncbi:hypothetical protein QZN30_05505 [Burkholderia multivorans]|jgi:hypothetical protein|nr:hypothetical protein [Burkholderia multivorans]